MQMLKVTNKRTGKSWKEMNRNHAWSELVLEMWKDNPKCRLVYCDIEGLMFHEDTWYILDECGNWDYLPAHYEVEVLNEI